MTKRLFLFALLALPAFAQFFRVDPPAVLTSTANAPYAGMPRVFAASGTRVKLCLDSACATAATTYTDAGGGTPCPSTAQVVKAGTSTCSPYTDNLGNYGFWVAAGTYYVKFTLSSGAVYGPYALSNIITLPNFQQPLSQSVQRTYNSKVSEGVSIRDFGAVGNGLTNDSQSLVNCAAAAGICTVPPGNFLISSNITLPKTAAISFNGGVLKPSTGVTVTLNGPVLSPPVQVFGGAGTVLATGPGGTAYPQWWGVAADGATDDAPAIQAAVNAVAATGPIGVASRHMGLVLIPPSTYTIKSTITIPAGGQMEIRGEANESNWGSVLEAGTYAGCIMQVTADSTTISNLFFKASGSASGICLGTSSSVTFDSHIYLNWFQGLYYAIHGVKYSGGQFLNNTMELGTFGLYSSTDAGDGNFDSVIFSGNRVFQNGGGGVLISGDGTKKYASLVISDNIFDFNSNSDLLPGGGQVIIRGAINPRITANTFRSNDACCSLTGVDDIVLQSSFGGVIAASAHYNTGRNPINVNGDSGLVISGVSVRNCNINSNGGLTAAILSDNTVNMTIDGVSVTSDSGKNLCTYGIYVGTSATGTRISATSVQAQATGAYNILDLNASTVEGGVFRSIGPGSSSSPGSLAYFGSGTSAATAGNFYGISVDKSGTDSLLLGINKNTPTGDVPANGAFVSTFSPNNLCLGRGDGSGVPRYCDILITGSGGVKLGSGGLASHAVCFKSDGKSLGYCTTTPTSGICTCN